MKKILFVDDESNVLQGLRRLLRPMRDEWEMSFSESGADALAQLETQGFDVIVTDMRMPGMDGAELLETVAERYPNIARIILSGHAERSSAVRAAGVAHQFLAKPCDADVLKATVRRTCDLRARLTTERVKERIAGLGRLPSLPEVVVKVTEEVRSPEPTIKRVGELVAQDVAMSAKVLQLVNSAFFGLSRKIESVNQAANLLGVDTVRDLVLTSAAFEAFADDAAPISLEALQKHALLSSSMAVAIAKHLGLDKDLANETVQAALLQDIGRLALAARCPQEYGEIVQDVASGTDLIAAETAKIGCGHPEIGGYILGLWGLPDTVVEAVTLHHSGVADPPPNVAIVFSTDKLCSAVSKTDVDVEALADALRPVELSSEAQQLLDIGRKCYERSQR